MNKLCIGLLFATAIAWAGIGVVNFPYGEKSGGPDACRAIQLNVQGVSPASGTVSIGEITAKWETVETNYFIRIEGTDAFDGNFPAIETLNLPSWTFESTISESLSASVGLYKDGARWEYDCRIEGTFGDEEFHYSDYRYIDEFSIPWTQEFEGQGSQTGKVVSLTLYSVIGSVPHATTNALWTVTASGGNATNNLPDKTFLRFAGHDFVRYGTATGGVVNLFVED